MRVAGRVSGVHPRTSREPGLVTVMEDCVYVRGGRGPGGRWVRVSSTAECRTCAMSRADCWWVSEPEDASRRRSRVKTLYRSICDFARDESRRRIRSEKKEQFFVSSLVKPFLRPRPPPISFYRFDVFLHRGFVLKSSLHHSCALPIFIFLIRCSFWFFKT